jgi:hypothetical protein
VGAAELLRISFEREKECKVQGLKPEWQLTDTNGKRRGEQREEEQRRCVTEQRNDGAPSSLLWKRLVNMVFACFSSSGPRLMSA